MQKKILLGVWCLLFSSFISGFQQQYSPGAITLRNCGIKIGQGREGKIVGGTDAEPNEYPFMVSLQIVKPGPPTRSFHYCGAAILNENWIITAAHCIKSNASPSMYEVLIGLHKQSERNDPTIQRIKISKFFRYADIDYQKGDIALLKTSQPIDIAGSRGKANGICLPTSNDDPTGTATVMGWGDGYHTGTTLTGSDTLKEVEVPLVPRDRCNRAYSRVTPITERMICAGYANKDACQSDSGGPLIQRDRVGRATLIGIVSFGIDCGHPLFPGVYTKVSYFLPWLAYVISRN